ncbi:hypothetical protein PR002_g23737 [Phytophthora rubi]|uniref:Uncharacterized protein n=1 Tax=Phytophthora rubi TaxID=129364 RepID=A0A6A3IF20_9STRA|nr:hypothetical protein PR002_g23737 [Phytophthora rubi]
MRTTAQEVELERSERQAPARLAKRKSGGVENVRDPTQRKSGDDHGTAEVPGKDGEAREADGQKVILPFTCHGVTTLEQAGERQANVRLAKTVKVTTNTLNLVRVKVDAPDGTTGVFVPKPSSKRHLVMSPTAATVHEGVVRVAVINIEGKREKLPAREVLDTWVPTEDTMQMLSLNAELEKARVKEWVSALRKEDGKPMKNEASFGRWSPTSVTWSSRCCVSTRR